MSVTPLHHLADLDAIREVRYRFGDALDRRDWEAFGALFTAEVDADFSQFGVPAARMPREGVVAILRHAFRREGMRTMQAYSGFLVRVEGDRATMTSLLHGFHHAPGLEGGEVFEIRARYLDRLVRGTQGWRIEALTLEVIAVTGNLAMVA